MEAETLPNNASPDDVQEKVLDSLQIVRSSSVAWGQGWGATPNKQEGSGFREVSTMQKPPGR